MRLLVRSPPAFSISGQPDNLPLCGGYAVVLWVARDKVSRRVAADARGEGEGRARALLALTKCFGQALGSKFATVKCTYYLPGYHCFKKHVCTFSCLNVPPSG